MKRGESEGSIHDCVLAGLLARDNNPPPPSLLSQHTAKWDESL